MEEVNNSPLPPYAITTPRLHLQLLDVSLHLADYHLLYASPRTIAWSSKGLSTSVEQSLGNLKLCLKTPEQPFVECYGIILKPEHEGQKARLIGVVGVIRQEERKDCPGMVNLEVGYMIHVDFWGKGYATEASQAFLDLYWKLEDRKDVDEILALIDTENHPSKRVMAKVGAVKKEELVRGVWPVDGKPAPRFYEVWCMRRPVVEGR